MKKTILLQQDDCDPNTLKVFFEEFEKIFGIRFDVWKKEAKNISKYDDEVLYINKNIYAFNSAYEPQWIIYKNI
jgi:hypothetical protein